MKKFLRSFSAILGLALLFVTNTGNAQISYSEGFEGETSAWSDDLYFTAPIYACSGTNIFVGETYSFFGFNQAAVTQAAIGTSNGQLATLTYSYKLLDYYTEDTLPNTPDWGAITVSYSASASGPWTTIQTITPATHLASSNCAVKTATFSPPPGAVYLKFTAQANIDPDADLDFYLLFDDVTVTQAASVACSGTPAASAAVAALPIICNAQSASLSLSPFYTTTGLTYQWQSSANGTTYTNVATGGTSATYTTAQSASTWYRAIITCGAGGTAVTSTPVQVVNSGLECLCDVAFDGSVEPITLVEFAGINNTSSATIGGTPGVQDFTSLTPGEVTLGETYTITVQGNTNDFFEDGYEDFFTVYFDWNHNGDLTDAGEAYNVGSIIFSNGQDGVEATGQITVPAGAMTGLTSMRVFKLYDSYTDDPCSSELGYGYGQVEDYLVHVSAPAVPELTYVNLQWPPTLTIAAGETGTVYAQAYGEGITEAAGAGTGVTAWIGINSTNTNPSTWANTVWVPATFNVQSGNNDEFMAAIGGSLAPGTYYYATRFKLNGGDYLYGGYSATGGGFWTAATNVSGVLTVNCNVDAPMMAGELAYCSGVTGADLPTEGGLVWYFGPTGDNAIPDATVLTTGTYYAAQVDGNCESATRTGVLLNVTTVIADDPADVTACDSYVLPVLTAGNNYYTGPGGTGTQLNAGDVITATIDVHVRAVSSENQACNNENVFTITINNAAIITGDATQSFEAGATIADIDVNTTEGATVTWYASEGIAVPLPATTPLVDGVTYYVMQTIGDCSSAMFAVTVDVALGTDGFTTKNFSYYPNPVSNVLNLKYTKTITGVEVYNMLGQKVLSNVPNQNETQVNVSQLAAGTYMVKVTADETATLIKIVKQ